jgi:hypothetical protein
LTAGLTDKIVIHEKTSANADPRAIHEATELGGRVLDPGTTKVFNALPQETDPRASSIELQRMGGIVGTRDAWAAVNRRIRESAEGFTVHSAKKTALLSELQYGNSSVVVIYAHFDGERLYLPGSNGETMSVDEIASIDRTRDSTVRNRVIILASCSTAAKPVNSQAQSLVQVLLQKGIARTVFATDRPYDARDIPALMARLKSMPLREASGALQQHVELEQPQSFPEPFLKKFKGEEVFSGE